MLAWETSADARGQVLC